MWHMAFVNTDPAAGVGALTAVFAGLVSFLSPCVLPLVPGYLSTVIGVAPGELQGRQRLRVLAPSLLFVATFSTVFVMLGLTATALGQTLRAQQPVLEKISAVLIILMGALFLLAPFVPRLSREWRPPSLLARAGRKGGPIAAGAAFAIAWTPCIGPTLGAILSAAALSTSEAHGALLLAFYSAGLALPFLVTAIAFHRATKAFAWVRRHYPVIIAVGGAVLIAMGILIWSGEFFTLNIKAQQALSSLGLNFYNI